MIFDEEDVRVMLRTEDIPPTGVDLDAVVATGRRKVAGRRIAAVAGGLTLAAAVVAAVGVPYALRSPRPAPPAAAQPTATARPSAVSSAAPPMPVVNCAVTRLPVPHGLPVNFQPTLISPNGRYIVAFQSSNVVYRSVLWTDGVPEVLDLPGVDGSVEAVNSHGVAIVDAYASGFRSESLYRMAGGVSKKLSVPMSGDWHYYEIHMNAAGAVVAYAEPQGNSGGSGAVALLWKAGTNSAVKLAISDPDQVSGLLDDGRIIGVSAPSKYSYGYVTIWDADGRNGRRLGASVPHGESAVVDAVARSGFAAGGLYVGPADQPGGVAWAGTPVWDLATGLYTNLLYVDAPLVSVNAGGWAVDNTGHVGAAGKHVQLAVPAGAGVVSAVAIADDRTVVGVAHKSRTDPTAIPVIWHC